MIINNVRSKDRNLVEEKDIFAGAYFSNGLANDCDVAIFKTILVGSYTMVNMHAFCTVLEAVPKNKIVEWLNDKYYFALEVEITVV